MTEPNGFYYMRARYYDPEVGRFISEDPIGFEGGDVNLYLYASNNPVLLIDPSGLKEASGSFGFGGTIVGGWGDRSLGISAGLSVNVGKNGSVSIQAQLTKWDKVYGAYYGIGKQYGFGITEPQASGLSATGPQYTIGGGFGYRGRGADVAFMGDSANGNVSAQGALSTRARSGNANGIFIATGKTISIQYVWPDVWNKLFGN
jgi:RHS repeat-associated protein